MNTIHKENDTMKSNRTYTFKQLMEIVTALILFSITIVMRILPAEMRDDSGEAYIVMAILVTIGSALLYFGLLREDKP